MQSILIIILALVVLTGCGLLGVQHNTELEASIHSIVEDKQKSEIELKSLKIFNWDKAIHITPYTTQEGIDEKLGFEFKDPT